MYLAFRTLGKKRIELRSNEKIPISDKKDKFVTCRSYHFGVEFKTFNSLFLRAGLISGKAFHSIYSIYRNRHTFTTGLGLKANQLCVNFSIIFDDRKKDIEKTTSEIGPIIVNGSTFKFLLSADCEL